MMLENQLRTAKLRGDAHAAQEIMERLLEFTDLPIYHATGFSHPEVLIYTDRSPQFPEVATWGLVPPWVRDEDQLKKTWNSTLNARGETIFEKNSFRSAAKNSRCLIYVDGFYEHHHFGKDTYPFFIHRKDGEPMILAGLYSDWENPETGGKMTTFSIVTTSGNSMMAKIHNNPKLEIGPRMPVILPEELADKWLLEYHDELDKQSLDELMTAYPEEEMAAHPVRKIRGKNGVGNVEEASQPFHYPELPDLNVA